MTEGSPPGERAHQMPVRARLRHSPARVWSGFRARSLRKHLELGAEPAAEIVGGVRSAPVGCPCLDKLQPVLGSCHVGGA